MIKMAVAVLVGISLITVTILVLVRGRKGFTPDLSVGDPFGVGDPWRRHVATARSLQRRFSRVIGAIDDGPRRASMAAVGIQLDGGVDACEDIARLADGFDHSLQHLGNQLDAAARLRHARQETDQRLGTLVSRLGDLVGEAAGRTGDPQASSAFAEDVADVVTQLLMLRTAVEEMNVTGRSSAFTPSGPVDASGATPGSL